MLKEIKLFLPFLLLFFSFVILKPRRLPANFFRSICHALISISCFISAFGQFHKIPEVFLNQDLKQLLIFFSAFLMRPTWLSWLARGLMGYVRDSNPR